MGVNLREVIPETARREVEIKSLKGYVIAIDAYNALYQFLAAIRQPDGTPLMDRSGRVTSHLSGLFYRTINLVEEGVKPVYVFDGKPPELKRKELEERAKRKEAAEEKYREYSEAGLLEEARKYRIQALRLTNEMVEEAKRLLEAMGIPWIQAPAEGEAQAAYLTIKGDAWAAGSQDYDSLLFGAKRLVRNLAITGKRKLPGRSQYVEIKPEIIELEKLLSSLGIDRKKLVLLGLLLGTDFNPGGVNGIEPKTAHRYVKPAGDPLKLLKSIAGDEDLVKAYQFFLNPPVTSEYKIEFKPPNEEKIKEILVREHDFNPERVENAASRLRKAYKENLKASQKRLDAWFR